ncbi:MAG: hypothetical protein ABSF00_11955 [Candidatus Bathyarchaeia archaeon]
MNRRPWALRTTYLHLALITLLLMAVASPLPVFAARKMLMQATLNPTQTDQGVTVAITGRVFDTLNYSIPSTVISIQVNNPQGTSVHLAIAYTNLGGSFQDTFFIGSNSPGGNYTTFLVADKPGYDTARVTLVFTYSSPDFALQTSVSALSLRQGGTGTVSVTVFGLRGFHAPVNLTALELPAGVSLQFKPASIAPGGTVTVNIASSIFAVPGNYTITLLGVSGSVSHKVSFELNIAPGLIQAVYLFIGFTVILVLVLFLLLRRRGKQKRKEAAVEDLIKQSSADKGYVATARAIARLEELRAMDRVDESTYLRLRREYEKRLEKSK